MRKQSVVESGESAGEETGMTPIPQEVVEALRKPLPSEAIKPHPSKPYLSTIKVPYVIERLNDVFGLNGWVDSYEVVEAGEMIVVKGKLEVPQYGIVRVGYGGNDNSDRGDAFKGACTDALSKMASFLYIGMDVYKGLGDKAPKEKKEKENTEAGRTVKTFEGSVESIRYNKDETEQWIKIVNAIEIQLPSQDRIPIEGMLPCLVKNEAWQANFRAWGQGSLVSVTGLVRKNRNDETYLELRVAPGKLEAPGAAEATRPLSSPKSKAKVKSLEITEEDYPLVQQLKDSVTLANVSKAAGIKPSFPVQEPEFTVCAAHGKFEGNGNCPKCEF